MLCATVRVYVCFDVVSIVFTDTETYESRLQCPGHYYVGAESHITEFSWDNSVFNGSRIVLQKDHSLTSRNSEQSPLVVIVGQEVRV